MDSDKLKKRQSLKVIISEAIMVLAVIAMVAVLAMMVSGYWLNSDFKVERQGMLQVSSIPTGADLIIDGESSWLQRTNTSKIVSSGEHTVVVTKEGYDTWSKTVKVSEGLLYRLHYPRLFPNEREVETVLDVQGVIMATISPDKDKILLIGDTTEWQIANLKNDTLEPKPLNVSDYLSGTSLAEGATVGLFTGKILSADWDRNGSHALFKIEIGDHTEWVLIDVENVKNSINLTREFGANFSQVEIIDNSASNLLAVQDNNLRRIDVPGKSVSAVLVENVVNFDHYENEIIFSAASRDNNYVIGLFKLGDDKITELEFSVEPRKVAISKFYDEMYITTLGNNVMSLYKKTDFTPVTDFSLSFAPQHLEVGHNGEFIIAYSDNHLATLDMEVSSVNEWSVDGATFDWIDNDMIYSVANGELIVYDFDGLNRRALAKNVFSHLPAAISDNKWLYYFSDGSLVRERLIPR